MGLPDWKRKGKTISYILGIFENECLYQAYQYGLDNELITARRANLAYDGSTTPPPPACTDHAFHLDAVNDYIFEKTGFKMKLEVKPFEDRTIQMDLIEARRNLVVAEVVNPVEAMITEVDMLVAEDTEDLPQVYLIWKEKFERLHTKVINNASYFKKIFERLPNDEERFEGYKVFSRGDFGQCLRTRLV